MEYLPLHEAVRAGDVTLVERLLADAPETLNATDDRGRTALHVAAAYGHFRAAGALLAGGADPTLRDASGETAARLARAGRHHRILHEISRYAAAASPRQPAYPAHAPSAPTSALLARA